MRLLFVEQSLGVFREFENPDAFFKGKNAQEGDDHIGYDQKSGKMYYDENGDDAGGRILFAQFDKGTKIKVSDIDVSELGVG